jgi:hypothetical protein
VNQRVLLFPADTYDVVGEVGLYAEASNGVLHDWEGVGEGLAVRARAGRRAAAVARVAATSIDLTASLQHRNAQHRGDARFIASVVIDFSYARYSINSWGHQYILGL